MNAAVPDPDESTVLPSAQSSAPVAAATPRRRSHLADRLRLFALMAYGLVGAFGLIALRVPSLKRRMTDQDLSSTLLSPLSDGYLLGTDVLGRDFVWRLIGGLGVSLAVGLSAAALSIGLGLLLGILGGFYGRSAAATTSVLIDLTWAFPAILLAIVFAGWLGPGLRAVVLALALTGWAAFARIVRGEVLSLREREFIAAARVLGVPKRVVAVRHLIPNLIPLTLVMSVFFVATSIVAEAGLSFLGLGAQGSTPSLGIILSDGRDYLTVTAWPVVLAGGVLTGLVLLLNSLSDSLRDRFDPHRRHDA